jgi:large subunit ribosomal protein L24e
MVERRVCSFCGNEIEPGTGKMYIKIDGTIYNFCKNKCHKNLIELKRVPRRTTWTQQYIREKSSKIAQKGGKASKGKRGKPAKKKVMKQKKVPKKETEEKKENKKEPKADEKAEE